MGLKNRADLLEISKLSKRGSRVKFKGLNFALNISIIKIGERIGRSIQIMSIV